MLHPKEIEKYSRQIQLDEVGKNGQEKLKRSRILVVGAGGLGCPVISYLAAAGIGKIGIIDSDVVEESNLQRQVLYDESDIGKNKSIVASEKISRLNSLISIKAFPERLVASNVEKLFGQFDIIVDCTDNFSTRYLISDACSLLNLPVVCGSIHRFQGQVSVFNYRSANVPMPGLRSLYPAPPGKILAPSCADAGVLGILPGLIGMLQANETLKMILGIGEILTGKVLCLDALSMTTGILTFERNEKYEMQAPGSMHELRSKNYSFDCNDQPSAKNISPGALKLLLDSPDDIQLIDVRNMNETATPSKFKTVKIPLPEIESRKSEIQTGKNVIFFCSTGKRSAAAVEILNSKHGFSNVYNLEGGLDAWIKVMGKTESE